MQITIFGTGYVGLVTGACFADVGHQVTCVDIDQDKIDRLKLGTVPIFEPGLGAMVARNLKQGSLAFTTETGAAIRSAAIIFIAVGTPPEEDGSADLSHVLDVASVIGGHIDGYKVIVNKSTVPVGTAELVADRIAAEQARRGSTHPFDVCSNPEFLKEGNALEDFLRPARIVVGTQSDTVLRMLRECYAPYNRNHDKLMPMDVRSAELTKYAANAMLATKISFMSEIANLAERLGANIEQVRQGIGSDPRIGYHFIYPGCGYGGSCFPKDVRALARTATSVDLEPTLLNAVETVNRRQKNVLFEKLFQIFDGNLRGRTIALWGLSFKPNTDDMRDAPSETLIRSLWKAGAKIQAFDPEASGAARRLFGERDDLVLAKRQQDAVVGADALVICTEWKQFRIVDFAFLKAQLSRPVIVDGRNLYDPEDVSRHGLLYYAIGRGDSYSLHEERSREKAG